eukprot:CAMPEP_0117697424 /NCGR_PEP_ID=MMETSP0804-20121206/29225_1 /TAXON_ID=1074897 /ORGANISM="Tetraselmis astigmatica, Strain CCMP880" /LENGTH=695 /DNA_ID=CAMNT_0005511681 /DNA_START=84 /DNA_END=2172 /DNA_ORIENTATION=+
MDPEGNRGSAQRRLGALSAQLCPADADTASGLTVTPASATAAAGVDPKVISQDPLGNYAIDLPEILTEKGSWDVRRSVRSPRELVHRYPAPDDHIKTLYDNLELSVSRFHNEPKPGRYKWTTFSEVGAARTAAGSALLHYGIEPGSTVGLYSVNCSEWVVLDAACHAYSMVSVPLYDTLGPDAVRYICGHAELSAVACSFSVLPIMLQCLPECPTVKLLIVYGSNGRPMPYPSTNTCRMVLYEHLLEEGRRYLSPHKTPKPEDLATICYTSGTTGVPKGAMLTHANLISNSASTAPFIGLGPGDRHISYLPLAHIYERVTLVSVLHCGCAMGFYMGDVQTLLEDIMELKPTIFLSVPRLWNRIYDKVMAQVNSGSAVARSLFQMAYASKKAAMDSGDISGGRLAPFWDRVVFSKIKEKLGGEVRLLGTGASPIAKEVFEFMRICFGAQVIEGYGMTETSCTISLTDPEDLQIGHVGAPVPCNEVKLVDVPEMKYTNADQPFPRGEVCVRGPNVFKGYYKAEEQTTEVLDADGWLHTGDIGMWLPGGRLKIIDRKKNIFKLAQGEYIAPEKIESVYQRCPMIAQTFVYGDSLKAELVAVVVLDPEVVLPWASSQGLPSDLDALCSNPVVIREVFQKMLEEGRAAKLKGFEQVAAVHLVAEPFSVENNLLTPTFKLKRPQAKEAFQADIDRMYAGLQ